MMKTRAVILLSAHEYCPYLAEQVKSIVGQMEDADLLVIVDDGSRAVCWEEIADHLPSNYQYWSRLENIGYSRSFLDLLFEDYGGHTAWYFFSDQDDIWMSEKISTQKKITTPDVISVQGVLIDCAKSHNKAPDERKLLPIKQKSHYHYYFETPAPGMTFCIGSEMRSLLVNEKNAIWQAASILPHDRIIAGIAGAYNKIVIENDVFVLYRQHDSNAIGAKKQNRLRKRLGQISRYKNIFTQTMISGNLALEVEKNKSNSVKSKKAIYHQQLRISVIESFFLRVLVYFLSQYKKEFKLGDK